MKKTGFALLRILHLALLSGQLIFSGVVFYLVYSKIMIPSLQEQDKTFQLVTIAIAVIAYYSGNYLFKKKMLQLKENVNASINEKFVQYRTACLLQWALLEAATLVCGISFLFYFPLFARPFTASKIICDLRDCLTFCTPVRSKCSSWEFGRV